MTLCLFVLYFHVRKRGLATGAPIDDVVAAINEPFFVEPDKNFTHRPGKPGIHGKTFPGPVTGAAQPLQLFDDSSARLLFPLPYPFNEGFSSQGLRSEPFFRELPFNDVLRRYSRVVHAGQPERVIPAHPLVSRGNVLERVVQGVTHVQHTRHVGRWYDYTEWRFFGNALCPEITFFQPEAVPFPFDRIWLVDLICHELDSLSNLSISSLITFSAIS